MKKTHRQFRAALRQWGKDNPAALEWQNSWTTRRALYAAWWFIENMGPDDPSRTAIFFELREMVRGAG